MRELLLLGLAGALCVGCERTAAKACPADDVLTMEAGTGEIVYEPLEAGDEVPLYWGPQGGQHIYVSVAATGLPVKPVVEVLWELFVGTELVAGIGVAVEMKCNLDEGHFVSQGYQLGLYVDPADVVGQKSVLRTTFKPEVDGEESLVGELEIVVVDG